jgi:hypothetical protein
MDTRKEDECRKVRFIESIFLSTVRDTCVFGVAAKQVVPVVSRDRSTEEDAGVFWPNARTTLAFLVRGCVQLGDNWGSDLLIPLRRVLVQG